MTTKQYDKINELARKTRYGIKCNVELTDDYFTITEFNPSEQFVTITHSNGDYMEDFPVASLSDSIIDEILYQAEIAIG